MNFWTGVTRAEMPIFTLPEGPGRYRVQIFWSYDDDDVEDNETAETLTVTFGHRPERGHAEPAVAARFFAERHFPAALGPSISRRG